MLQESSALQHGMSHGPFKGCVRRAAPSFLSVQVVRTHSDV